MDTILIITKNILNEVDLEYKLKQLNFAVYCVTESILSSENIFVLRYFNTIIFSNNISNDEFEAGRKKISKSKRVFRLESEYAVQNEDHSYIPLKVSTGKINKEFKLEELREAMLSGTINKVDYTKEALNKKREMSLSKKEFSVLKCLYEGHGDTVNRSKICELVWGSVSNSSLSALSNIIRRLELKVYRTYLLEKSVDTKWGAGYSLSHDAHELFQSIGFFDT